MKRRLSKILIILIFTFSISLINSSYNKSQKIPKLQTICGNDDFIDDVETRSIHNEI